MFREPEVLVSAIKLTDIPQISIDYGAEQVEYFHLLLDEHSIIFAEGTPTESFHIGDAALHSLSEDARAELVEMFPDLQKGQFARHIPSGRLQKELMRRHSRNGKQLLELLLGSCEAIV